MSSHDSNKIFGDDSMIKDYDKEYCGTTQEVMFELKLNTNKFFKKFKESQKS